MTRAPAQLRGKLLWFQLDGTRRQATGFHEGRIVAVKVARNELRSITVAGFNPLTGAFNGRRIRLQPAEWSAAPCGLVWFHKLVPVAEWLGANQTTNRSPARRRSPRAGRLPSKVSQ